jgi:hypothetical protein
MNAPVNAAPATNAYTIPPEDAALVWSKLHCRRREAA